MRKRRWWYTTGGKVNQCLYLDRFGHTCSVYKNKFIIFGGERRFNSELHIKECYNDAIMFDPKMRWTHLKTFGHFIEPRRNHVAFVINQYLFVTGIVMTQIRWYKRLWWIDLWYGDAESRNIEMDCFGIQDSFWFWNGKPYSLINWVGLLFIYHSLWNSLKSQRQKEKVFQWGGVLLWWNL